MGRGAWSPPRSMNTHHQGHGTTPPRQGGTDLKLLVHVVVAFIQVFVQQSPFILHVNVGVKSSRQGLSQLGGRRDS